MKRIKLFSESLLLFSGLLFGSTAFGQSPFPNSAQKFFEEGEIRFDKRDYDEAIQYFNECLRLQANFAEAYYWRGLAHEQTRQLSFAISDFTTYLQLKPRNPEGLFNRGQVHYRLAQFSQAKEDFIELLAQRSVETNTVYFRRDAHTGGVDKLMTTHSSSRGQIFQLLGLAETKLNNHVAAVIAFDSALHYMPNDADTYVNRGIVHLTNGEQALALDDFKRALSINPQHALAKNNLYSLNKHTGVARLEPLDSLIDAAPWLPYGYAERAHISFQQKNYKAALEDYNQAIKLSPTTAEYYLNRGLVYEKLKQGNNAYNDYTKAIYLQEDFAMAWLNRGNVLLSLQKHTEAIQDYTAAITYTPEYGAAYYNRGVAYYQLKNTQSACRDLQIAKRLGQPVTDALLKKVCPTKP